MIDFLLVNQDQWYPKVEKETIVKLFKIINDKFQLVNNGVVHVYCADYEQFEFSFKQSVIATLNVAYGKSGFLGFEIRLPSSYLLKLPFNTNYNMKISSQFTVDRESWSCFILNENHIYSAGVDLYHLENRFEYYTKSNYLSYFKDFYIENNSIVEIVNDTLDYNEILETIRLSYIAYKRPDAFFEIFQEKDFKVALQKPMLNDKIEALKMILI